MFCINLLVDRFKTLLHSQSTSNSFLYPSTSNFCTLKSDQCRYPNFTRSDIHFRNLSLKIWVSRRRRLGKMVSDLIFEKTVWFTLSPLMVFSKPVERLAVYTSFWWFNASYLCFKGWSELRKPYKTIIGHHLQEASCACYSTTNSNPSNKYINITHCIFPNLWSCSLKLDRTRKQKHLISPTNSKISRKRVNLCVSRMPTIQLTRIWVHYPINVNMGPFVCCGVSNFASPVQSLK